MAARALSLALDEESRVPLVEFEPQDLVEIIEDLTPEKLASLIDVTDLKADTQQPKIRKMVDWALDYGFYSICVNPVEVDLLPTLLKDSPVKETYVLDFPLGKASIQSKRRQAAEIVETSRNLREEGPGKIELDMVINVGRFKVDRDYTREEIKAVVEAAEGELVKVIIRSGELTEEEIVEACRIVKDAGADFVKNSTGMDALGATPEHIWLMRETVGPDMGVKAAGGIRDAMTVLRLLYAGAKKPELRTPDRFRIGTSGPLNILATMNWIKASPQAWAEAKVIPCTICPHGQTAKQRREVREIYVKRCRLCPYRRYRKDKDF
ncbi:MAG: deoxyribose-phosphate aldolase [Anaerolineae bacterium]|nr:deoxyribose-phosphate aldolase [Anaerolineae bacterium]NIN99009.1 deoxyribose-phosphate aldolase [Anaerolineae bacterium]NIQ81848.1 deoxyribose-phosphate aldolase [Anaerolineae bacterium]